MERMKSVFKRMRLANCLNVRNVESIVDVILGHGRRLYYSGEALAGEIESPALQLLHQLQSPQPGHSDIDFQSFLASYFHCHDIIVS